MYFRGDGKNVIKHFEEFFRFDVNYSKKRTARFSFLSLIDNLIPRHDCVFKTISQAIQLAYQAALSVPTRNWFMKTEIEEINRNLFYKDMNSD